MKYLIYSALFFTLLARGEDLLPGPGVENGEEARLSEPTPPAMVEGDPAPSIGDPEPSPSTDSLEPSPSMGNPEPALPPSDTPSIATNSEVSTQTKVKVDAPMAEEFPAPLDATAELSAPPPVAAPNYGPSAEEGYGSVGLKNDGGILEVTRDEEVIPKEAAKSEADRKTSSTAAQAELTEEQVPPAEAEPSKSANFESADSAFSEISP